MCMHTGDRNRDQVRGDLQKLLKLVELSNSCRLAMIDQDEAMESPAADHDHDQEA